MFVLVLLKSLFFWGGGILSKQAGPPRILSGLKRGNKHETILGNGDGGSTEVTAAFQRILGDKTHVKRTVNQNDKEIQDTLFNIQGGSDLRENILSLGMKP